MPSVLHRLGIFHLTVINLAVVNIW